MIRFLTSHHPLLLGALVFISLSSAPPLTHSQAAPMTPDKPQAKREVQGSDKQNRAGLSVFCGQELGHDLKALSCAQAVSDWEPLRGLTQLRALSLMGPAVDSLSSLTHLPEGLRSLTLKWASLRRPLDLKDAEQLKLLYLEHLSGLENLRSLERAEQLGVLAITHSALAQLPVIPARLHSLDLSYSTIGAFSPVERPQPRLIELKLRGASLPDIKALTRLSMFQSLEMIDLAETKFRDLESLSQLPRLQRVTLPEIELCGQLVSLTVQRLSCDTPLSSPDLEELPHLKELRSLKLIEPSPQDLKALSALQQLKELKLVGSGLFSVKTLKELSALESLSITGYDVVHLGGAQYLRRLSSAHLSGVAHPIQLTPLAQLSELRSLSIDNSSLAEVSALKGLISLKALSLSNVPLPELSALSELKLTRLSLIAPTFDPLELSPLQGSRDHLKQLTLASTQVKELSQLSALTQLETLSLGDLGPETFDLSPLAQLQRLERLALERLSISHLNPLASLGHLRALSLSGSSLSDWGELAQLSQLEGLNLSFTRLGDQELQSSLTELVQLRSLKLIGTAVSSLEPLQRLTRLERLLVDQTRVKSLQPLVGLSALKTLSAMHTPLLDLGALTQLNALKTFTYDPMVSVLAQRDEELSPLGFMLSLPTIELTLASPLQAPRFKLTTHLSVELPSAALRDQLQPEAHALRDVLRRLISSSSADQLSSPEHLEPLLQRMAAVIQRCAHLEPETHVRVWPDSWELTPIP